ncbi:site-2 protease family protein [Candidatus Binatia bacterium]|nr:site-2 protease family protein [Candidatus Binatia bacterium]
MSRQSGIDLFRIAGIQIAIDYSWIVIFLLVLWSLTAGYFPRYYPGYGWTQYLVIGTVGSFLFFASVLIHELSHAMVANRVGQSVKRITLFIFGGMAHLSREPSSARAELQIAAVGPLTSLGLGALFWVLQHFAVAARVDALWVALFEYLAFINVALAVFNLLPGFPLDGGRILRGILWLRSGNMRQATARAADWGAGIAAGVMALGVLQIFLGSLVGGLWMIFIGMFLRAAARASYHGVVVQHALGGVRVADLMIDRPEMLPADMTVTAAVDEHFLRHGYGGFPVTRDGLVAGIVTLTELKQCPPDERAQRRIGEFMRPADGAVRIDARASVADALRQMIEADTGRLLVTAGSRIVGLITRTGITRVIQMKTELEEER